MIEAVSEGFRSPCSTIREFDRTYGTAAQQFDFVLFLDGHERTKREVPAGLAEFRASCTRPKWHIVTHSCSVRVR